MKLNSLRIGVVVLLFLGLTLSGCGSKSDVAPGSVVDDPAAGEGADSGMDGRTGGIPGGGEATGDASERSAYADYVFKNVEFEFDRYRLTPAASAILTEHAKVLMENGSWTILLEGHCDERGTVEYNLALGEKRADSAKQFLTRYGIASSRVRVISYGKERPLAVGSTEEAWAKNRRCEFKVTR